jgi:predicted ATPase
MADLPTGTVTTNYHNLPAQRTALFGREQVVATVCSLLRKPEVRLLTLTGPGGVGKTRLGLQIAAELREDFADGVYFVALAPITDFTLLIPAIATALGVNEGGQPLFETLKIALQDKHRLLLLDNFEQVVAAAPLVAELLSAAPYVKVLATSRAALHLSGEREVAVPPLGLPDRADLPSLQRLAQYEAMRLFIERAQAVQAHFAVTSANASAVAEICHRLDGLPLAIELAAAWIKLFPPQALLARLGNRLKLLTGGARDLPARQQTMRDAIGWSYDLLAPGEQALFARLGVFVGGWSLEAAEAVCEEVGSCESEAGVASPTPNPQLLPPILDGIASLLDKSLIQPIQGLADEPRFTMLETIREYALERLAMSGEETARRRQHALHYLAMTIQAGQAHEAWEKDEIGQSLMAEIDNLQAALRWALDQHEWEIAQRMSAALFYFRADWFHHSKRLAWLEAALATGAGADASPTGDAARAIALDAAGWTAGHLGDYDRAQSYFIAGLAVSQNQGNSASTALAQRALGWVAMQRGALGEAQSWLEQSLALCREAQDPNGIAWSLCDLGYLTLARGEPAQAETLLVESLALFREQQNQFGCHRALLNLGHAARAREQADQATRWYQESLTTVPQRWRITSWIASALDSLAGIAQEHGRPERAARLLGAAEALRESIGEPLSPVMRTEYDRDVAATRAQLDEPTYAVARAAGRALPLEQVIAYALERNL